MNIDLSHKRALVGGGSTGLGRAAALELALCGAEVTVVSHNEEKLQRVLSQLDHSKGQNHQYLLTDYTDFDRYQNEITKYFENHSVDILINNTQGPHLGGIADLKIDDYQKAFDLLFKVNCFTTLLALPNMVNNHWGRVINISSMTVKEPLKYLVLSNTIRSAWQNWCKELASSYAEKGITCNTILTGLFETDRIIHLNQEAAERQGLSIEEIMKQRAAAIPIGRLGRPEEYGTVVAFLASAQSSYLTGVSIPLDGGAMKGY